MGRGRRFDESSLVPSPDEADASTGNQLEQREGNKNRGGLRKNWDWRKSLRGREKIPGLVPALPGKAFKISFLSLDTRGLNRSTDLAKLGAWLAYGQTGALR